MKRSYFALLMLLAAIKAYAAEPNYHDDPNALLQGMWSATVLVLQNKDLDYNDKSDKVDRILSPVFDFPLMAKLTLGEKHWPKLTAAQREEFTRLFVDKLKSSYRDKMFRYTNQTALFKPPVEARKGVVFIPMEILSERDKTQMLCKFRKSDNVWKVYDVEIEGVSVLLCYRSQVDDILSRGTVEELLARLAEKQPAR
jgi:ABC-type transport system involved in resistance to organic solvents, auxiliary component